jgi:transposase
MKSHCPNRYNKDIKRIWTVKQMDEATTIKTYNAGIDAVISLVKGINTSFTEQLNNLNDEIKTLNGRISELEARLNKNSDNSSKPPSSDGYKKPQNLRQKTGKSTGGQYGHEGKTLEKVENPDEVIEYKTPEDCDCGYNLNDVESVRKTRQVFDIPKPKPRVTEHVTYEKVCPRCGKVHKTEFPPEVTQPTQYGGNTKALMNYLTQYQMIPLERAVEAVQDITCQAVSEGTLVNAAHSLYEKLEAPAEEIKQQLIASDMAHFDETGMRSEGKTKWMHVASTEKLTYYAVHEKRGEKAARDIGILPNFRGTAMHDHWKPYYRFNDCTHAECNSHHLRSLKDIVENYHQDWANEMSGLLIAINRRVEALKASNADKMPDSEIKAWHQRYHNIIDAGIMEDAQKSPRVINKKGKPTKSKPLQLLLKLQQYDIETLAFMYDFGIPFTNNLAERDIRMQKLRQKISGCFRGKDGSNVFCRIRSYISTAKKNGIGAMDAITTAVKGQPFVPVR